MKTKKIINQWKIIGFIEITFTNTTFMGFRIGLAISSK